MSFCMLVPLTTWPVEMCWFVVSAMVVVAFCHRANTCNIREISRIVEDRFRKEAASTCGGLGNKCTFDRDCCEGMECKMSANKMGVDNYCEARVMSNVGEDTIPLAESGETPAQPSSPEDGYWMLASKSDTSRDGEEIKPRSNTLDKIDDLQEKRRAQLVKENEELEKLFTEKDEKELEQLRSLKEDAEMDELRRLKELKLKRKLDLLKEIEELRGLKAEKDLDTLDQLRNKPTPVPSENSANITMDDEMGGDGWNSTVGLDEHVPSEAESDNLLNTTIIETETSFQPKEEDITEATKTKHKQGIRHKKRHHQLKHKKKLHENQSNSTLS